MAVHGVPAVAAVAAAARGAAARGAAARGAARRGVAVHGIPAVAAAAQFEGSQRRSLRRGPKCVLLPILLVLD